MKLALIDADSLVWITAYHHREEEVFNPTGLDMAIKEILTTTGATHYLGFLGGESRATFRAKEFPDYKANRSDKPEFMKKWEKSILEHLAHRWKFITVTEIEADDAVSICHRQVWRYGENLNIYSEPGRILHDTPSLDPIIPTTLCSPDKDLKQVPGEFYDFGKKIGGHITKAEAEKCLWTQVLTGDTTDNIKGLPGIGPKKAEKILNLAFAYCGSTMIAYMEHFGTDKGIKEFYKNYTLIKMLESHPDFEIPTPIKVE